MQFDNRVEVLRQAINSWFLKVESGTHHGNAREEVFEEYNMDDVDKVLFIRSTKPTLDHTLDKYM